MTIEFECSSCGKPMRAPDGSSGKQGKCPQCGTITVIPTYEPAPTLQRRPTPAPSVKFNCQSCGKVVSTPASLAGKRGKCPHCGDVFTIPGATQEATAPPAPVKKTSAIANNNKRLIEFHCPACQNVVKASGENVGKKGKCPACQVVFVIPAQSNVRATQQIPPVAGRTPGAMPPHLAGPQLIPLPDQALMPLPGLAPLSDLMPLPNAHAGPYGNPSLTPLPDVGGAPFDNPCLMPLSDAGFQVMPTANFTSLPMAGADPLLGGYGPAMPPANPFADLPASNFGPAPFLNDGLGGMPPQPMPGMQSPAPRGGFGWLQKVTIRRKDVTRNGLPWEKKEEGAFFSTISEVLFKPNVAFSRMKCDGGIGAPMGFAILGGLAGTLANVVYQLLFMLAALALRYNELSQSNSTVEFKASGFVGIFILVAFMVAYSVIAVLFSSSFINLVFAGVLHLSLKVVVAANKSYETTFRVLSYCTGSIYAAGVIPIVGWFAGLALPVYLVLGLANAHETSKGRAAAALFIYVLFSIAIVSVLVLVFMTLIAALVSPAIRGR